jgi:UDP-galactopyranose mutase
MAATSRAMSNRYDVLVVGAGFAGAVCAERLASADKRVLVIDRRAHIGGNAYDRIDDAGIRVHVYGPHLFHTNGKRIFEYLSRFTEWRFYEHRVLAAVDGKLYPMPINRRTINDLYGLNLDEAGVGTFLQGVREPRTPIKTSEDVVLDSVGRDLCEKFFRGYTRKQWGLDLSELSAGVAARIPTRANDDDRYFTDSFQFMPASGYHALFEKMLSNPLIDIELDIEFDEIRAQGSFDLTVYTGPIDAYFDYRFGKLPYRSLDFEHLHLSETDRYQPVGTVNYPNEHEFTRITEFKHLTGQQCAGTSIVREYPRSYGEPYYPIPRPENEALYKRYQALANAEPDVKFVGRLAQYRYYNMDQVVGAALKTASEILGEATSELATN